MATSTSDRPPKRGRPKLGIAIKRIGLQAQVYDEWIIKKNSLGFSEKSNSDFANYLLRISDEQRGQTSPSGPCHSTPMGKQSRPQLCDYSPIFAMEDEPSHDEILDVTGISSLNVSTVESVSVTLNPEFGVYAGDISADSLSEDS
ncbi:Hypothetical predicted protein, partial [Paramuricea clavata]